MLVNKFWQKLTTLTASKDFWISYSGGQDSRVLLELCCLGVKLQQNKPDVQNTQSKLHSYKNQGNKDNQNNNSYQNNQFKFTANTTNYTVQAIHIDHGLHADSAKWAEHCKQVCAQLGVPL